MPVRECFRLNMKYVHFVCSFTMVFTVKVLNLKHIISPLSEKKHENNKIQYYHHLVSLFGFWLTNQHDVDNSHWKGWWGYENWVSHFSIGCPGTINENNKCTFVPNLHFLLQNIAVTSTCVTCKNWLSDKGRSPTFKSPIPNCWETI